MPHHNGKNFTKVTKVYKYKTRHILYMTTAMDASLATEIDLSILKYIDTIDDIDNVSDIATTVVSSNLNFACASEYVSERVSTIRQYREALNVLLQLPLMKQRSEEWFEARKTRLTASDLYDAIKGGNVSIKLAKKKANIVAAKGSAAALSSGSGGALVPRSGEAFVALASWSEFTGALSSSEFTGTKRLRRFGGDSGKLLAPSAASCCSSASSRWPGEIELPSADARSRRCSNAKVLSSQQLSSCTRAHRRNLVMASVRRYRSGTIRKAGRQNKPPSFAS